MKAEHDGDGGVGGSKPESVHELIGTFSILTGC